MDKCPKCNSYHIAGPRYFKWDYGQEELVYSCNNCGYQDSRPCADADAQSQARFPKDWPTPPEVQT